MYTPVLKNYRGRFPFKLATTSYIYPDEIVPNVARLAPSFDEIELVLFESAGKNSIPDKAQIDQLIELSRLHQLGFNVHLPIDISLGDEREEVKAQGTSIVKRVIERTLCLNPSLYTLHLDLKNPPIPPLIKGGRRGDYPNKVTSPLPLACLPVGRGERVRACPVLDTGVRGEKDLQDPDIEGWRLRLSGSLEEILDDGIEPKRISIETLGYPFEWIEDIVKRFGFSICLDIGHLLTHGYDLNHYLKSYLADTSIIHLHGVRNDRDHLGIEKLPERILDDILSRLRHYHGTVSLEVFSIDDLRSSLDILEEKWTRG